jgi:diguanylate cyclase (GGDEF)-like protein
LILCGLVTFLVLLLTHISIRRYQRKIQDLSRLDHLTGLANRAAFDEVITRYIHEQERTNMPLSMLMCDIDFFKNINDQYGHLAGDVALKLVAQVLQKRVRRYDVVVRWGGEEFLLLLKNCGQQDAQLIAEQIRIAVAEQQGQYQQHHFVMTLSIGVATRQQAEDLEVWLSRADCYLYEAKRLGRNRVVGEDQA